MSSNWCILFTSTTCYKRYSLFVDGNFHKLFTSVSISWNGTLVQSTELFGIENHLKVICGMDQIKFANIGDLMMYHTHIRRSKNPMFYDDTNFENVHTEYLIAKSHADRVVERRP